MRVRIVVPSCAVLFGCMLVSYIQAAQPATGNGPEPSKVEKRSAAGIGSRWHFGQAISRISAGASRTVKGGDAADQAPSGLGRGLSLTPPEVPGESVSEPSSLPAKSGAKKLRETSEPRDGLLKKVEPRKRSRNTGNDATPPALSEDGSEVTIPELDIPGEAPAKPPSPTAARPRFHWPLSRK